MTNSIYEKYQISKENGFLSADDPLIKLPSYYSPWNNIGRELPQLLLAGVLDDEVEKLPLLETKRLKNEQEMERAMLLLSFVAHAFLNGDHQQRKLLPKNIAIPWAQISKILGRPTVLAHASAVLNNWRRLDQSKPVRLDNIALLQPYQGGMDEAWFFLVTAAIEKEGAKIINAIVSLMNKKAEVFSMHLETIAVSLTEMTNLLQRIPEKCDPHVFYNRLRPFLGSLENVVFEGVAPSPVNLSGGSAAQSSLIQCIDAAIGIKHTENRSAAFLLEMRKFMPVKHKEFILYIENSDLSIILANKVYLNQVETIKSQLKKFRDEHLKIYHRYVASQQKKTAMGDKGTGGTKAVEFLKQVKEDTL